MDEPRQLSRQFGWQQPS